MKHHLQKILMQGINQFFPFHGREMEKKWTQWQTLISLTPKSLRTVTATIKLKDICSLERKLWQASVQLLSCVWLFATPWTAAHKASLFIINSQSLLKLMSIKSKIFTTWSFAEKVCWPLKAHQMLIVCQLMCVCIHTHTHICIHTYICYLTWY